MIQRTALNQREYASWGHGQQWHLHSARVPKCNWERGHDAWHGLNHSRRSCGKRVSCSSSLCSEEVYEGTLLSQAKRETNTVNSKTTVTFRLQVLGDFCVVFGRSCTRLCELALGQQGLVPAVPRLRVPRVLSPLKDAFPRRLDKEHAGIFYHWLDLNCSIFAEALG